MKKGTLLFFTLISMLTIMICSCKKDTIKEPEDNTNNNNINNNIRAEKTNVKTYEIVQLICNENLRDKYNGTFGTTAVILTKTSDSTLVFLVPDIPEGEAKLKFELSEITFNVTKTEEVNPTQFINNILQNFDNSIAQITPVEDEERAYIDTLKIFRQEFTKAFDALSEEQKKQTILFYTANRKIFKSFSENITNTYDAPTVYRKQSECSKVNYKTFYDCTAANLSSSYDEFDKSLVKLSDMVILGGGMGLTALQLSALGPAALGITAVGLALPVGYGTYIAIFEVLPATLTLFSNSKDFLGIPWVFREEIFNEIQTQYSSEFNTELNLAPGFRTIREGDYNITPNTGLFLNALTRLKNEWNDFSSLFGDLPSFISNTNTTTLSPSDITISNISNPKVQYLGNTGHSIKFKSLSGDDENFSFNIKVNKEGFTEEKTINSKVVKSPDNDKDGVINLYDNCHETPTGTQVDANGCSNCPPPVITITKATCTGSYKLMVEGTYTGELSTLPYYDINYDFVDNPTYSSRYLFQPSHGGAVYHSIIVNKTNKTFYFVSYPQTCDWWAASTVKVSLRLLSSESNCNKTCCCNENDCFNWVYDWSNEASITYTK